MGGVEVQLRSFLKSAIIGSERTSLYLVKQYQYHIDMGGVEVQLHSFLKSALIGSERSTSCPGCLTQEKELPVHTG
jgi:hypothetical protein